MGETGLTAFPERRSRDGAVRLLLWNAITLLACVAAAWLGWRLDPLIDPVAAVWPATGVAFAALLVCGGGVWPGVLLANLAIYALLDVPVAVMLAASGAATVMPVLAARLLLGHLGLDIALHRVRDVFYFCVVGVLQAVVAAPAVGVVAMVATTGLAWPDAMGFWLRWALIDSVGVLTVTPLLLWILGRDRGGARGDTLQFLIAMAVLTLATVYFFSFSPPVGYPALLVVVWIAMRHSQREVIMAVLCVTVVALWDIMHPGPHLTFSAPTSLLRVLDFLIFMAASALLMGGLVSEHRRSQQLLLQSNEARLRQSENRFEDVFEASTQGMAIVSLEGRWLRVNRALCDILGYGREDLLAMSMQDITYPGDRDADGFRELLTGQVRSLKFEKRYIHRSGRMLTVELGVALVRDTAGAAQNFLVQVMDITDRKRAEDLWRFGLESAADAVWDWDIPSGRVAITGRAQEIFGFGDGQVPATIAQWRATVHPEDRAMVDRKLADLLSVAGTNHACEHRSLCGDGSYKWILSRGLVIARDRDDKPLRAVGTFADITALREADTERTAVLKQYSDLVLTARDPIVVIDRGGIIQLANPATESLFGYPVGDLLGQPLGLILPQDVRQAHGSWIQIFFEGEEVTRAMAPLRTVRGLTRGGEHVLLQITLSKSSLNGRELATAMIRDVTEIQQLQERLHQTDKLAALGQLTGGVAHDVNNDLGVIVGSAELILERAAPDSREEALATRIISTVRRSMDLVRRMLAFSRQADIAPEKIELAGFLDGFIDTLGRTLGAHIQIRLLGAQAPRAYWVHLDRSMLESALINLCINARDAMPGGGVLTLSVASETGEGGDCVLLTVADTGTGMSDTVRRRIFEPFFTTKPAGGGTGLGLATVYGYVEQSGGRIDVESQIGSGTRFLLRFPQVAPPVHVVQEAAAAKSRTSGRQRNILLVDDNASLRLTLREQLALMDCQVREAATFDQATRLLRSGEAFDFIISDFDLGAGGNGIELAQWVNDNGYRIPGVIISGYLNMPSAVPANWQTLQKPVRLAELRRLLAGIEAPALAPVASRGTVLVVEDNADMRFVAAEILKRHGLDVVEAASAAEALARLRQPGPLDLVLTDLGLPDMSGRTLAEKMRQERPGLEVLLMSGSLSGASAEDLEPSGYLQKPFTRESLMRYVDAALAARGPLSRKGD